MHEQGIFQSFSGSEGIADRPGDSRTEGDIEIHLARMIFAGSAVCQRDEIDVAPIVALVLHLSPDKKRQERSGSVYVVKKGDTLGAIARRYRVTTAQIMRWNKLKSAHKLRIGQRLRIEGR